MMLGLAMLVSLPLGARSCFLAIKYDYDAASGLLPDNAGTSPQVEHHMNQLQSWDVREIR